MSPEIILSQVQITGHLDNREICPQTSLLHPNPLPLKLVLPSKLPYPSRQIPMHLKHGHGSFLFAAKSLILKWVSAVKQLNSKFTTLNNSAFLGPDQFSSVQFSRSVMSDSLRPHVSQQARPPCPSPTPRVYSNSCPSSR